VSNVTSGVVPEITPVLEFKLKPEGNAPDSIVIVYGAVPPVIDNVFDTDKFLLYAASWPGGSTNLGAPGAKY
jgi:hypothetical protein